MNILVFGGTGFLGKNLVDKLLRDGHTVGLYVREPALQTEFIKNRRNKLKIHVGDFQNEQDFGKVIQDYEIVYHLVSATIPGIINPIKDVETTIIPTLHLLEACIKYPIKKFIFFSSGGTVYGIPKELPIKEEYCDQPISSYGIQKQSIERYILFYNYCYGLPVSILRISNPYGKYQRPFSKQGLIANVLGCYFTNKPVKIWGDGNIIRDYIYVDDVIDAAEKAMFYQGDYKIFNVGAGKGYSINEVIELIDDIVESNLVIERYPGRKVDVLVNILDNERAKSELNWHPKVVLRQGIKKMLSFWDADKNNFEHDQL